MVNDKIFKAYDIRGVYPSELNEGVVYAIAQAYAKLVQPKTIALGRDVRLSGLRLWNAAAKGLTDAGVTVIDIGVVTTDMLYFASAAYGYDGGITISASHNPGEYNGLKMMRAGAVAISGETGITEIRDTVLSGYKHKAEKQGSVKARDIRQDYIDKCLSFVDIDSIKPLRVVVNGMFGPVVQNVEALNLGLELVKLNAEPDGSFPKGAPDPLLPENRTETEHLVRHGQVAFGAAWDGDADRFFLFDETGRFIPGYFLTAFLGAHFSKRTPGSKILYDPRLTWATEDAVRVAGGVALINKVGHSFIKERMRAEEAIFGGENSGHFYFQDFYYADNGLIPFLLILEIVSKSGKKVSELFEPFFKKHFLSDELNFPLESVKQSDLVLKKIEYAYPDAAFSYVDGLSVEYSKWRANIRPSNTQPLLRVNVEARTSEVLEQKMNELRKLVESS
jgi:phosphomannomutase